jgi:iron complex outermembrane recepter protein
VDPPIFGRAIEQSKPQPSETGCRRPGRHPAKCTTILAGIGLLASNVTAANMAAADDPNAGAQSTAQPTAPPSATTSGANASTTSGANASATTNKPAQTKHHSVTTANGPAAAGKSASTSGSTIIAPTSPTAGVLLAGGAVAAATDAAVAATTAPTEEVTVTARRRKENVQDVPIPVTVLSAQQLQDAGINKVQQLQYQVPSTSFFFSNTRNAEIAIRGLGNNPANDGLVDSVGVYMDGVYLDRVAMATFGLFDINQVEVLRGPQGTLFGKNTSAGAVNITTNLPTFTPEAAFEADLGSYNTREYTGFVSAPIPGAWVAARLSFDLNSHSPYVTTLNGTTPFDDLSRNSFRAQLLYKPDDQFSVRMIGEYGVEEDHSGFSILYSEGPSNPANTAFNTFAKWTVHAGVSPIVDPDGFVTDANGPQYMQESGGGLTTITDWKSNAGYTLTSISAIRTWDFQPHNNNIDSIAPPASDGIPLSQQDINQDKEASQELRLASPLGGPIDYVAGMYYFWNQLLGQQQTWYGADYSTVFGGNPVLDGTISNFYTNPTTNSFAIFGQGNWHITPRLTLTAGLRETVETTSIDINRPLPIGLVGTLPTTSIPYQGSDSITNWNPSGLLTLSYKITPDVLGYVSAAQSSKAGGFNAPAIPAQSGTTFLPVSSLVIYPETANSVETGVKSSWWDNKLTVNGDAFFTRVNGYQAQATIATILGSVPVVDNVGAVITNGFELEMDARPIPGLTLSSFGSWNPAYYESFRDAPSVQGSTSPTQDLTSSPVVGAPRWTGGVSGTYSWPLGPNLVAYAYANYAYKSGQFGYIDNSPYSWIKPYGLANFRLGMIVHDRYELVAWVQNAFNTPNFYNVSVMAGGLGGYTAAPGIPRVAGVTLRVKF